MIVRLSWALSTGALLMLAGWALPAAAQSTNAAPVIVVNAAPVDLTTLPLAADGQKAVTDAIASLKAGSWVAHVTTSTPDGKFWSGNPAVKGGFVNIADLARQSLEECEYGAHGPCVIIEINGHDTRDAQGGWPTQPQMLQDPSGALFDNRTVPFVGMGDRVTISGYALATGPRALIVTGSGGWTWSGGTTSFDAISKALAAAQKTIGTSAAFILYAVNDRVVFAP
jgi:hypothetical protein